MQLGGHSLEAKSGPPVRDVVQDMDMKVIGRIGALDNAAHFVYDGQLSSAPTEILTSWTVAFQLVAGGRGGGGWGITPSRASARSYKSVDSSSTGASTTVLPSGSQE